MRSALTRRTKGLHARFEYKSLWENERKRRTKVFRKEGDADDVEEQCDDLRDDHVDVPLELLVRGCMW